MTLNPIENLLPKGILFENTKIFRIDYEFNMAYGNNNTRYNYSYLILSCGIEQDLKGVKGIEVALSLEDPCVFDLTSEENCNKIRLFLNNYSKNLMNKVSYKQKVMIDKKEGCFLFCSSNKKESSLLEMIYFFVLLLNNEEFVGKIESLRFKFLFPIDIYELIDSDSHSHSQSMLSDGNDLYRRLLVRYINMLLYLKENSHSHSHSHSNKDKENQYYPELDMIFNKKTTSKLLNLHIEIVNNSEISSVSDDSIEYLNLSTDFISTSYYDIMFYYPNTKIPSFLTLGTTLQEVNQHKNVFFLGSIMSSSIDKTVFNCYLQSVYVSNIMKSINFQLENRFHQENIQYKPLDLISLSYKNYFFIYNFSNNHDLNVRNIRKSFVFNKCLSDFLNNPLSFFGRGLFKWFFSVELYKKINRINKIKIS